MSITIDAIRQDVIGGNSFIDGPFGRKPLIYADYTASGRALHSIERYIQHEVLPVYANTHSESSHTGRQTTQLREQARQIIHQAVNGSDEDLVIFCGSGATAAIHKLIDILNLRLPADLNARYGFNEQIPSHQRPVVFIGPYEHHSNELPWRESIADLVVIPLSDDGQIDTSTLESELRNYQSRPLKLGSFSAASNVTGIKSDTDGISRLLHRYGALSLWDYAAAAPYTAISMSGTVDEADDSHKDAVFISPHKFIGGPGTPGVLVVKKALLTNSVPAMPGGGTVSFVTPDRHRYLSDTVGREEGGTPAIVESIRAGLVFKLQQDIGTARIEALESDLIRRAIKHWQQNANIEVLGSTEQQRLSIASIQIRYQDKYLHYGFVVALLNDLFGIQTRGGCSCAGPYGHQLLGINDATSQAIEQAVDAGEMIIRPGWVRLNFNYFISESEFNYILQAIDLIATYAKRMLPFYQFDMQRACWRFQAQPAEQSRRLADFSIAYQAADNGETGPADYQQLLRDAEQELTKARPQAQHYAVPLSEPFQYLRWFAVAQDRPA